jgi:chemotaxis signal transduction protein
VTEAAEPERAEQEAERALCVLFSRGADRYALRAADVHKVFEPGWINRLPRLPDAVVGITQHRGRIVTVVDLARVFRRSDEPETPWVSPQARILILERGQRHLGLFVDAVDQIANVRLEGEADEAGLRVVSHAGRAICALEARTLALRLLDLAGDDRP